MKADKFTIFKRERERESGILETFNLRATLMPYIHTGMDGWRYPKISK